MLGGGMNDGLKATKQDQAIPDDARETVCRIVLLWQGTNQAGMVESDGLGIISHVQIRTRAIA